MLERAIFAMLFVSALSSGITGGVLFAFSNFVMKALARLPLAQGTAAMQAINVRDQSAIHGGFLRTGSALSCHDRGEFVRTPTKALIILASMIYLFGCLGVTIVFNVPMNDSLAMVKPYSFEAAALWPRYLASWTTWNHVRTVAAILAAVAFTLTLNDPFSATD